MGKARPESTGQTHQFDAFLVGNSTFGRLRSGARALYFTVETFKLYASWCYVRILVIAILCNQTLVILTVTLTMTDVPSKHVWKIKESRIVFKDFDIFISIYFSFTGILRLTIWPAPSWLDSSIGRALHWHRRGHGFEYRSSLNFFQAFLSQLL